MNVLNISFYLLQDGEIQVSQKLESLDLTNFSLDEVKIGKFLFDTYISPSSKLSNLTDFNLWNKPLTINEMIQWTNCQEMIYGNIIDWRNALWESTDIDNSDSIYSKICQKINTEIGIFNEKSFPDAKKESKAFRGRIYVVENEEVQNNILSEMESSNNSCPCNIPFDICYFPVGYARLIIVLFLSLEWMG